MSSETVHQLDQSQVQDAHLEEDREFHLWHPMPRGQFERSWSAASHIVGKADNLDRVQEGGSMLQVEGNTDEVLATVQDAEIADKKEDETFAARY